MKLLISQKDLAAALSKGAAVAPKNSPIPVLNNVRLIAHAGMLKIASTDLDRFAEAKVPAALEKLGSTTVPAAQFIALVARLPREAQVLLEMEDRHLIVKAGRSRSKLPTQPVDQFPGWVDSEPEATFELDGGDFAKFFGRARGATANDSIAFIMQGVQLRVAGGNLLFDATNKHVIACLDMPAPAGSETCPNIIVPNEALDAALKVFKDAAAVTVRPSATTITFEAGDVRLGSKLIEGEGPDCRRAVPPRGNPAVTFDRAALAESLARADLVTEEGQYSAAILIPREDGFDLKGMNSKGAEVREYVEGEITAGFALCGFNPAYLSMFLSSFTAEKLTIEQKDPKLAHLIYADDEPEFTGVIGAVGVNQSMAA